MESVDDVLFHRMTPHGHSRDLGVWAALYPVARPVTAHRHDFYEIAFALTGSGHHEDEGGRLPILSGDVWIVRPGQWHAYPLVGGNLAIFNLLMTEVFLDTHTPAMASITLLCGETDGDGVTRAPPPSRVAHMRLPTSGLERVRLLLAELARELRARDIPGQDCVCGGLTLHVLGLLVRHGTSAADVARDDPGVLAAVHHIEERYAEPLTLTELARHSGYAPTYLVRAFRRRLGTSPIDYLIGVRLHHACALLEATDDLVTTIAHAVGFSDSRYFAARFHRALGVTPSAFRAALRNG